MDYIKQNVKMLSPNLFNTKPSFRSKTISTYSSKGLTSVSTSEVDDKLLKRPMRKRMPSMAISTESKDDSDDDSSNSSILPLSPRIPTKDEIADKDAYMAPCERRISDLKKMYLINEKMPKLKTTMSKVEFGVCSDDFTPLAFKTVFNKEDAERELLFLNKVKALPYVVQLIDTFLDNEGNYVLVLPVLHTMPLTKLDLADVAKYTKQLLEALDGLHARNIVHMDITPANLMADENGDLVLIDFGLSTFIDGKIHCPSCGTPGFIAPEVFQKGALCTSKVDIYSAGIILGCMLEPFIAGCDLQYLGGNMVRSNTTESVISHLQSFCSHSPPSTIFLQHNHSTSSIDNSSLDIPRIIYMAADLLEHTLTTDPTYRYSTKQLLEHPFFQLYNERDQKLVDPFLGTDLKSCEDRKRVLAYREHQWHSVEESEDDCYYSFY